MRHEKVEIEIKGRRVKVDREIAPLVQALNELPGVDTAGSCQESADTRLAFVSFSVSDAQGDQADDASVCRVLRGIDAALRRSRLWARVSLDFTPDSLARHKPSLNIPTAKRTGGSNPLCSSNEALRTAGPVHVTPVAVGDQAVGGDPLALKAAR